MTDAELQAIRIRVSVAEHYVRTQAESDCAVLLEELDTMKRVYQLAEKQYRQRIDALIK